VEEGVSGALFTPGSIEAAADSVAALLADTGRRERLGRRARETVLARFAPEPALAHLARALERAAAGG